MEENEIFNFEYASPVKIKMKRKKNIMNLKFILSIITIFIFALFFVIILFLAAENTDLKNIINNNKYHDQNFLSLNISDKNFLENVIDYNDNISVSKNLIHVSYSLDSKLVYPTYISMLSGLENCNQENLLVYHLLLSHDFNKSQIPFFETLKEKYQVKIYYYIIPNMFGRLRKWTSGTDCVYYKILLPFMFPDLERIIYLDGDTLIRKDIYEMYNYPFNGSYILGFPFYMGYVMKRYGIKRPKHYINGGVLLFNIKKIRRDKKDLDLLYETIKKWYKWGFLEQDSINYVFYPKIGFLPLKYGIYMIGSKGTFKGLSRKIYSKLNLTEGYEAVKDPSLVHFSCCWPKVWTNGTKNLFGNKKICLRYQNEFYYYVNKTRYFKDIYNKLFFRKNITKKIKKIKKKKFSI